MRTVMHCTAGSVAAQRRALANAENLLADDAVDLAALAVVFNGDGAHAVRAGTAVTERVRDLLERGGGAGPSVAVCVCSNSLAARGIDPDGLLEGVRVVSSGMGELTRRQADGYAYIRVP